MFILECLRENTRAALLTHSTALKGYIACVECCCDVAELLKNEELRRSYNCGKQAIRDNGTLISTALDEYWAR